MTYLSTLRWFTASALALAACNGSKSVGEYGTDGGSGDDDGSGGGSGDGDGSGAVSVSGSASDTSAGTQGDGGTASDSDAETSVGSAESGDGTDTGSSGACEGEGNCVLYPISCETVQCGGTSVFDDDGCVHRACTGDPTVCTAGELCYRPMDFGGCQSSAVGCVDDETTMSCQCGTLPDCGGAYCLPERAWPSPDPGPDGGANVRHSCAPDDGPAFELRFGLQSDACDAIPQAGESFASIRLDYIDAAPGTYLFGDFVGGQGNYDPGDGNLSTDGNGWVVIDAWDADSVAGTYHLIVPEVAYLSGTFDVPYCDAPALCG